MSLTPAQKLETIKNKDFTYVTATYFDPNQKDEYGTDQMRHDRFIVLSASLPVVRSVARQIALSRLPEGGYLADDPTGAWNIQHPDSGLCRGRNGALSFYPRNYIGWAKNIVKDNSQDVYSIQTTTTVSFS